MAWQVGYSQNTHGFFVNYGMQIYSLNYDEIYSGLYYNDIVESDIIASQLASASIIKYKKRVMRELEVMPFSYSKKDYCNYYTTNNGTYAIDGKKVVRWSSYIRYFKGYSLFKPDKKVVLFLGLSAGLQYDRLSILPYYSSVFNMYNTKINFDLALNPYVKFKITDNYYFSAGIPFSFFDFEALFSREDNPQLPEKMRNSTTFGITTFPKNYLFKIGAGLEF